MINFSEPSLIPLLDNPTCVGYTNTQLCYDWCLEQHATVALEPLTLVVLALMCFGGYGLLMMSAKGSLWRDYLFVMGVLFLFFYILQIVMLSS